MLSNLTVLEVTGSLSISVTLSLAKRITSETESMKSSASDPEAKISKSFTLIASFWAVNSKEATNGEVALPKIFLSLSVSVSVLSTNIVRVPTPDIVKSLAECPGKPEATTSSPSSSSTSID